MMDKKAGTLVISLDFELMWGMFDKVTIEQYGDRIRGVHEVVPKLLELFVQYEIHATWATVGMLMFDSKAALEAALPKAVPQYRLPELSAYNHLKVANITDTDQHYFAPALVRKIITTPGQELASHTFSHYYCLEEQVSGEAGKASFAADCQAMQTIAAQYGQTLTSIVFPRNQQSTEALDICKEYGLTAYRGTEQHAIYKPRNERSKTNLILRGLRLLDRYLNLTGHHTTPINRGSGEKLVNIPASRQFHPYSKKLSFLEPLKLRRIKTSMTHAAKRGEIFHLWWHPHNFGIDQEKNLTQLKSILEHYKQLQMKHQMTSQNMAELAQE